MVVRSPPSLSKFLILFSILVGLAILVLVFITFLTIRPSSVLVAPSSSQIVNVSHNPIGPAASTSEFAPLISAHLVPTPTITQNRSMLPANYTLGNNTPAAANLPSLEPATQPGAQNSPAYTPQANDSAQALSSFDPATNSSASDMASFNPNQHAAADVSSIVA